MPASPVRTAVVRLPATRGGILALAAVLVGAIAAVNVAGGHRIGLSVFYLVPLSLATWSLGRRWGLAFALGAAALDPATDGLAGVRHEHVLVPIWDFVAQAVFYVVVAYVLAELRSALDRERELARTDPLTGLANRRSFFERANMEIERSLRYGRPFSLAVFDVDDFKQVNDRFGHAVGDAVLRAVVTAIQSNTRATDLVARLGGDEFAVLLPETDSEPAQALLGKLQALLQEAMQALRWPVTVSIGLVTFDAPPSSVDELIRRADSLMYQVKRAGKNQLKHDVVTW